MTASRNALRSADLRARKEAASKGSRKFVVFVEGAARDFIVDAFDEKGAKAIALWNFGTDAVRAA